MGYGRAAAHVPISFICDGCGLTVAILMNAGKDYIWEDTCHEAARILERNCGWRFDGHTAGGAGYGPSCAECVREFFQEPEK